jgi:hypothetical protein
MVMADERWQVGDPLGPVEAAMLECAASGQVLDGTDAGTGSGSPGVGGDAVRADVLRNLLIADDWPVDPKGVRLHGVRIDGRLDLEAATVRCPLVMVDCDLVDPNPVAFNRATIPLLNLRKCRLAGFSGDSITVAGNLALSESQFTGPVVVTGARIGGAMQFSGTQIGRDEDWNSLHCHGMSVRLSVHFNEGFTASGAIRMPRAEIGGEFICRDVRLGADHGGMSINAPGIKVGGAVYLNEEFSAHGAVRLVGGSIGGQFSCDGAHLGADKDGNSLYCDGLRIRGSMTMNLGATGTDFVSAGTVRLAGAEISGSLTCRGARLGANGYGNALVGDELRASVSVLLENGVSAAGAVRFPGATVRGQFRCDSIQITAADADGCALACTGMKVDGPAHLAGGFAAAGSVVLSGADFGGTLCLTSAQIESDLSKRSLVGDGVKVGRDLLLDEAACSGGVLLEGASIGGTLDCRAARLGIDKDKNSLAGGRLIAGGDVNLVNAVAAGAVVLPGARIGGLLRCAGAHISGNASGIALNCNGSRIDRAVLLNSTLDGALFVAEGMVQLVSAETRGSLRCEGARLLSSATGKAGFIGDGMRVGGSAYLNDEFTTTGSISLRQASIGGSLDCGDAVLRPVSDHYALLADQADVAGSVLLHLGFQAEGAISLRGALIGGELRWEPAKPILGEVNLEGAHAQYLADEWGDGRKLGLWPAGRLSIAGFIYGAFAGHTHATTNERLEWIRAQYQLRTPIPSQAIAPDHTASTLGREHPAASASSASWNVPPFAMQPYSQLAHVYRQAGQDDEARIVEIAMRRDLRKYGNLTPQQKTINWFLDATIRYGFNTGRALVGILALYFVTFLALIAAQHSNGLIIAADLNNPSLHPTAMHCVAQYPCFYPAGYAFDTVVPLINIHQADFWQISGHHSYGWAWVTGTWIATSLGWLLATLLVVGYSGLARKQ